MHRLRHPVRAIREPFGTAGLIVACVALIAALGGTALAAKGALTGKQKKEVEKIAKKFAGQPGAPGASGLVGPQGAVGPKGDKGDAGQNGTNGTNGTDGEDGMCTAGNPECSLPSGSTLVGVWGASGEAGGGEIEGKPIEGKQPYFSLVPISFNVRVSPAPTAVVEMAIGGFHIGLELTDGNFSYFGPNKTLSNAKQAEEDEKAYLAACPGSADEPEAAPGFVCIYIGNKEGTFQLASNPALQESASEFGVVIPWSIAPEGNGRGTWAVTAK